MKSSFDFDYHSNLEFKKSYFSKFVRFLSPHCLLDPSFQHEQAASGLTQISHQSPLNHTHITTVSVFYYCSMKPAEDLQQTLLRLQD